MSPPSSTIMRTLAITAITLAVSSVAPIGAAHAQGAGSFEYQVFALTNQARARGAVCGGVRMRPAPPLVWDSRLSNAARQWSRRMAAAGRISHNGMRQRIRAIGISVCTRRRVYGENVAYNFSPQRVVRAWMRSPGHCRNIMNPSFGMLGVGIVQRGRRALLHPALSLQPALLAPDLYLG